MHCAELLATEPAVIAVGAWLKNTACRRDGAGTVFSAPHGDLGDPQACVALDASLARLLAEAAGPIAAVAHDLHPDFYSTRRALALAAELGVPAIGVQHHHAHVAAVIAEHGLQRPVIGIALDGFGLGPDGAAWGGELLRVDACGFGRVGHLRPLALPGGDAAAREPWRMAASALHGLGRGHEIGARFGPIVGDTAAQLMRRMLGQGLNAPPTTSAGRWFDAAAAALGLCWRQAHEAQAAVALEQRAARWLAAGHAIVPIECPVQAGVLDPGPLLAHLLDQAPHGTDAASDAMRDALAACFHVSLGLAIADWAAAAASRADLDTVCLGGGCFFNAVLSAQVIDRLAQHRLRVLRPQRHACGDAGLALGQAWVVSRQLQATRSTPPSRSVPKPCASPFQPA